ncbi:hypothetical protein, partial [Bacillus sp. SRB_331]|uniref:hypothetical protein n=1 Tax=Bacillus sp. SRB_331 TaxID=1969379 RepID=UPI0015EC75D3
MVEIKNTKYVFRDVIGIGNCAFEAIRASGAIPNMTVQNLRKEICEFARNPEQGRTIAKKLKPYIGSLPNNDSIGLDEYLNIMSIDRQWGGLFELSITAYKFKMNIIVVSQTNPTLITDIQKWIENTLPKSRDVTPWTKTIYLLHHKHGKPSTPMRHQDLNHYGTLFPIETTASEWNNSGMMTPDKCDL